MTKTFGEVRARAFCHATEDLDRVRQALVNIVGECDISEERAEGHHGNPITILSAIAGRAGAAEGLLRRLGRATLEDVASTLAQRVDESCGLHLRFDKQAAFRGNLELSSGGDVISVRIRILAYPAKQDAATTSVAKYLEELIRCS